MDPTRRSRSDAEWLAGLDLESQDHPDVCQDLAVLLGRSLRRVLGDRLRTLDLDDVVQDSLLQILRSRDHFRGDSRFTTWATAIALRVAFTELRRRKVREGRMVPFDAVLAEAAAWGRDGSPEPAEIVESHGLVEALQQAIASSLTERQRVAILAELRGLPTVEIATRLGTNQNALYKLIHDARKKLRLALERRGFGADALHGFVAEAPSR